MTNTITYTGTENTMMQVYNKKDKDNRIATSDSLEKMKSMLARFWGQENQDLIKITYTGLVFNNEKNTYVIIHRLKKNVYDIGFVAVFCGDI